MKNALLKEQKLLLMSEVTELCFELTWIYGTRTGLKHVNGAKHGNQCCWKTLFSFMFCTLFCPGFRCGDRGLSSSLTDYFFQSNSGSSHPSSLCCRDGKLGQGPKKSAWCFELWSGWPITFALPKESVASGFASFFALTEVSVFLLAKKTPTASRCSEQRLPRYRYSHLIRIKWIIQIPR